ncbi:DUF6624 domain-containing protein [Streptomyces seoulensis]|uniref:DUF6624 domain-containing protein n=1 Tax=Streptomyces seoulensis TaxID=73044 RepID=UPI001FCA92E7|nr:DUF6624 domain-containing protein [Streptomyces seoulensis]BDH07150.1 hypothetical protein HEK131_43770 [Streptomyces seoulensis]
MHPPLQPFLARELLARANQAADRWTRHVRDDLDGILLGQGRHQDYASGKILSRVVGEYGWPGHRLVGPDAARAAWQLAMHADDQPGFQHVAALLLRRAVDAGDAPAHQWAFLHDRALLNNGEQQEFGTQCHLGLDGPQAYPVRDPVRLDDRRAAVCLPPAVAALAELREQLVVSPHEVTETIILTALADAA